MNLKLKIAGGILAAGALIALPTAANANPGDFSFSGTVLGVSMTGTGTGTLASGSSTSSGSWSGSAAGSGTLVGCINYSMTFDDDISWATPNATQDIDNVVVTIDSTGCGFPPQGICELTLDDGPYTLTSNNWAVDPSEPHVVMHGDFTSNQVIGDFTINDVQDCADGLADQIRLGLADISGNEGTGPGDAAAGLGANLHKHLHLT